MTGARLASGRLAELSPSRAQWLALTLGLLIICAGTALRVADPYEFRLARELVFDKFQRLAPRSFAPAPVRVVDIDEASLAAIGQWPWPRSDLARLIERLHELGASAIALDMVLPEPDRLSPSRIARQDDLKAAIGPAAADALSERLPDNDKRLGETIAGRSVVLGFAVAPGANGSRPPMKAGLAFTGAKPHSALAGFAAATVNLPALDAAAAGVGAITVSPLDVQGVVRRIPLFWSDGERVFPSLLIEALRVASRETTVLVHSRDTAPLAITAARVGDFEIPTTNAGELRVRFGHENPDRYVSALHLMSDTVGPTLRSLIADHIVLIGTSATGLFDARVTALGETVPGVAVQAQALEQILSGDHLRRPDWVDPLECSWIVLLGLLVTAVTVFCAPVTALVYGGIAAATSFLAAWGAFRLDGLLLDPLLPSATGLLLYLALTSFRYFVSDRERRFVRQAFARYVAPSYLAQIERDPTSLRLGGDERELTVLFLDIRSFTSLSERLSPTEVVNFLNLLFGRLSKDILAEGGTIDKYIGDSLMAFWNAPILVPDHAARACRAALRMQESLRELNEQDAFRFRQHPEPMPEVAVGIGINTGLALVGNMGSEIRFNYSVVGDAVNVAARAEGQCKSLCSDIVVAESVAAAAPDFAFLEAGTIELKGKTRQGNLLVLVGDEGLASSAAFGRLRQLHRDLIARLRRDAGDWGHALFACSTLVESTFPQLQQFYSAFSERVRDFRTAPDYTVEASRGNSIASAEPPRPSRRPAALR